jgi:arylsulfatase A-like enzyme
MNSITSVTLAAALLVPLTALHAAESQPAKPNIIFILVDDMGWTDLACFGSKFYKTPHIDPLAAQGMRFNNA